MSLPRVVALLPAYNAAAFIESTLATLAAQTYPHLEILISDDASSDATATICERFSLTDPRARVLRQTQRLGWVGNSNALLAAARGDYLFFAGHDDLLAPIYVDELVAALEADSAAVLAFADGQRQRVDGVVIDWSFAGLDHAGDCLKQAIAIARQPPCWPVPYRGLFRATAARRIEGLQRHAAGEFGADWPWLLHMALLGRFVRVPQLLFRKVTRRRGLALTWDYSAWDYVGVTLSCLRQVRRVSLRPGERLRLNAALVRTGANHALGAVRRRRRSPVRDSFRTRP